jgi:hypothetical protein
VAIHYFSASSSAADVERALSEAAEHQQPPPARRENKCLEVSLSSLSPQESIYHRRRSIYVCTTMRACADDKTMAFNIIYVHTRPLDHLPERSPHSSQSGRMTMRDVVCGTKMRTKKNTKNVVVCQLAGCLSLSLESNLRCITSTSSSRTTERLILIDCTTALRATVLERDYVIMYSHPYNTTYGLVG